MGYRDKSDEYVETLHVPHSLDVERSVLGAILKDRDALDVVCSVVSGGNPFYNDKHRLIFKVALALHSYSEPCDITTVADELFKLGHLERVGNRTYLVGLAESVASTANVENWAEIIVEKEMYRRIIRSCETLMKCSYQQTEPPSVLLSEQMQSLIKLSEHRSKGEFRRLGDWVPEMLSELERVQAGEIVLGVPTGFEGIDKRTGGYQKASLVILAGRPTTGKTALANCMATNMVMAGHTVGFFSAETKGTEFAMRSLCTQACLDSMELRQGQIAEHEWIELRRMQSKMAEWRYFVDDTSSIDVNDIVSRATKLKRDEDVEIIFIDYLQIIKTTGKFQNRAAEVGYVTWRMKELAKALDIPVVLICQLNRDSEIRGGNSWRAKRPRKADLRESGEIEQHADLIQGIFRPSEFIKKHGKDAGKYDGIAEVITLKQRNGPTGIDQLMFNPQYTRFEHMEPLEEDGC